MKKLTILLALFIGLSAFKSDKPAYRFFTAQGKKIKYEKLIKQLETADVVFFGELHNNPISHWFELEITKDLYQKRNGQLVLGAEMFERDNQLLIDEYFKGQISKKSFEEETRLWPNYKTDYKPLLEFAHKNKLAFIATNVPRRYASLVYKHGVEALDSLSAEAKNYLAPLPFPYDSELKCYKDMLNQMKLMGHGNPNFPKAQAIKDATMAASIAKHAGNGKLFIHYNGSYHSDNYQGILWYLNQYKPGLKILTISSVEQASVDSLSNESLNKANFILAIPEDMTKTY
jgi:uncharacterized iron-regulated protein